MIVKKVLLVASAATLMSTPALGLPSQAPSNRGTAHAPTSTPNEPPTTTPNNTNNPSVAHRSPTANHAIENSGSDHKDNHDSGNSGNAGPDNPGSSDPNKPSHPGHPGQSHKCNPHSVAYIASGTLLSQTLTKNTDGTYSGDVTLSVTHTNRHAAGDQGTTKTYTLTNAPVTFGVADVNHDGSVGLDDLNTGDSVKLIAKITTLARKCSQSGFTATTTIRRITFHTPATS
jgi:hypothetical protein